MLTLFLQRTIGAIVVILFSILPIDAQLPLSNKTIWGEHTYMGNPWVSNLSRPYRLRSGLQRRHLYISPSHGRFFDGYRWKWQRPQMFCSVEDLLTQSFLFPYLIPMLENAGAVVYSSRERDPQPNEAIVDNDQPGRNGSYTEINTQQTGEPIKHSTWETAPEKGFSQPLTTLHAHTMPFVAGTARYVAAVSDENRLSYVQWTPRIPEQGRYAVYVSYPTLPNAVNDAHYIVYHAGQSTHFQVNQQMGGGTWVYLGTFWFEAGESPQNCVVLSNKSQMQGVVSADAVRFGGGMGNIDRIAASHHTTLSDTTITKALIPKGVTSGLPRSLEGSRYYAQWAGLPDSLFDYRDNPTDYDDDIRSRSHLVNYLGGGSVYMPDTIGKAVPFELALAVHTDAGFNREDQPLGTLGIVTTTHPETSKTTYRSGLNRTASLDLASLMLTTLVSDISRIYNIDWPYRELRDRNYGETRSPEVPSMILELLAHQNFRDMTFAHDPQFKFHASRAIYKSLLRYVAAMHNIERTVVQPLPVHNFSALLTSEGDAVELSWTATSDSLESSAEAEDFIVYMRTATTDFDNGRLTHGKTSLRLPIERGQHYIFKVAAVNAGGESFLSQPLSVYASHNTTPLRAILLINAFDRLSGPARISSTDSVGFDLDTDLGVPYDYTTAFCGRQINFSRAAVGEEGPTGLGYSTSEMIGQLIAGNRFDGIEHHTQAISQSRLPFGVAVSSMSRDAFEHISSQQLKSFVLLDYICGLQRDVAHNFSPFPCFPPKAQQLLESFQDNGGSLMVSGSFIGSDMPDSLQKDFLRRLLHVEHEGSVRHDTLGTFTGLRLELPIYNHHNAYHYACRESDILSPTHGAFSAFSYGINGYSAGVAYPGSQGRTITMGFPFECIADEGIRTQAMTAILKFLLP